VRGDVRIALVGPVHPWRGGIAQYLGMLGEALSARAEVRAVTFTRQYPEWLFPGKSQRDESAPRPRFPVTPAIDTIDPFSWRRAARELESFAPGLVLLKWWLPYFGPAFAASVGPLRRHGTRVGLVCDNLVPHERRIGDAFFTRLMLRNSDGYLVMSESVELDLDRLKPGAPRRRVPHPLYAQFDRGRWTRESARARLGLEGEVAVFFGYVRRYKGLDTLLEAWPKVRARRPVTLVAAGEFYEDPAPYRALAADARGWDMRSARFTLFRDRHDVSRRSRPPTCGPAVPLRHESGVTHVAYALGVPVIITDVGGLGETVEAERTGLVVRRAIPARSPTKWCASSPRAGTPAARRRRGDPRCARLGHPRRPRRRARRPARTGARLAMSFAAPATSRAAPAPGTVATARWIAVFAFCAYLVTGGGRIVGSDEVTMLELSRAMLHGHLDVPEGATLRGPDGRAYTKNAAGQAVLALPLVAAGELVARAAHLDEPRRSLAVRFVASIFDAWVTALLLAVFYAAARGLGVGGAAALGATLLLGFTTPVWVYAKSYMAEPLQALGLLLAVTGSAVAETRGARRLAAIGFFLAVSVKASMGPIALVCTLPLLSVRGGRGFVPVLVAAGLALAGHLLYDLARFGNPLETGYGAQATLAAYTTPLLVGLYGLLISSGKGVVWFAPAIALAVPGWNRMRHAEPSARRAAFGIAGAWLVALVLYATFEHWAGDGSFGPRYLVPLLPLAFLAVAWALDRGSRAVRRVAWMLGALGFVVQIGGVSIHYGAEMREVGDYPYTRALADPHFMSDSHFNPAFSPIAGHWRMLLRNAGEHLRGEAPRLTGEGEADARVGIGAADQRRLLHALDYWWLYLLYAGLPLGLVAPLLLVLMAVTLAAALALRRAATVEARAA
jgi:glycosyltransferase involved in cell wall biosynthesis